MAHDMTPPETGGSDRAFREHRWLRITAGIVVVALLAVGAWQVVELHHEVSDLQTQSQSQQARLVGQQKQLSLLNAAVAGSTTGATLSQIQDQISRIEGNTTGLAVRIGCVYQALQDATVPSSNLEYGSIIPGASLNVPIIC